MANINNLYIRLHDGLGNRLFKVASGFGIAKKQNRNLFVSYILNTFHNTSGIDYMKTIFRKLTVKNIESSEYKTFIEKEEESLTFLNVPNYKEDILIRGYYQNEKYFKEYKNELYNLFEMEESRKNYLKSKYPDLENTYFLHVRRGDYIKDINKMHYIDLTKYYTNCFLLFKPTDKFLIFSDDIEYCKNMDILKNKNISFVDKLENELDSLYLMSLCYLGGIAVNSTFSWWGSYLNENPNKIVTFPNKWFNNDWNKSDIPWENSTVVSIK